MAEDIYSRFTKKSSITKSIQLELVPQGRTAQTIEEKGFEDYDAAVRSLTEEIAPYVDSFVRSLADRALAGTRFDFSLLEPQDGRKGQGKKEKDAAEALEKAVLLSLKEAARGTIGSTAKINSAEFINRHLPSYIKGSGMPKDEKERALLLLREMEGKTEASRQFFITRVTALETWMPKRVIENMEKYRANAAAFREILASDFGAEVLAEWPQAGDMAAMEGYAGCLTQEGIDRYNHALSGDVTAEKVEKKGIIMLISEHNRADRGNAFPVPGFLFKQILMPHEKAFTVETVASDGEAYEVMKEAAERNAPGAERFLSLIEEADPSGVVVEHNSLHRFSGIACGDHARIPEKVKEEALEEAEAKLAAASTAAERRRAQKEIAGLDRALAKTRHTVEELSRLMGEDLMKAYRTAARAAVLYAREAEREALRRTGEGGSVREDEATAAMCKDMFDAWTKVRDAMRAIRRKDTQAGSHAFYESLDMASEEMRAMHKAQQLIVAWATRKPGDAAVKTLSMMGTASRTASMWLKPDGKLTLGTHTVMRRAGKYYYYILAPGTKPQNLNGAGPDAVFTQKKAQNALQFLPKMTFTRAGKFFAENPDEDVFVIREKVEKPLQLTRALWEIKEKNLYTKGALRDGTVTEEKYRENLLSVISFYRDFMDVYEEYATFGIKLKPLEEYADSGEFFADVNAQNASSAWIPCDGEKMDRLVEEGKALCFLVTNRTMYKEGAKKTSYAKTFLLALEDAGSGIMLNSKPKILRRKASKKRTVTHRKGSILVNRTAKDGSRIPEDVYEELYRYYNDMLFAPDLSKEALGYARNGSAVTHKAKKDIIKDRRYTEDKWFIAISVTKNRSVPQKTLRLNSEAAALAQGMNVLSVTRSEQDLLYYTVTAPDGELLESASLNVIDGKDYWEELKGIGDARREEKSKQWKYGRKVKDMRDGYLSHAVAALGRKAAEYQAAVVLEYIPEGVKDRFSALDNTVFKNFEAKLVAHLSDLFFPDVPDGEPGSLSNPYQLCQGNGSRYQDGIVWFVPASFTGSADPWTGFVNVFDTRDIATAASKKLFLSKFTSIVWDRKERRFKFTFDYDRFRTKALPAKTEWTVTAGGESVRFDREHKCNVYTAETGPDAMARLMERGYAPESDFAKLALDGTLTGKDADILYGIFMDAARGVVKRHDGMRKAYVSPVDGKRIDYAENASRNLAKKWKWSLMDKEERGEWIDCIA